MSDFIDRQALCDDLREYKVHPVPVSSDESEVKGYNDGIDLAISVIAEFPSVEPERKKGHWVPVTNRRGGFECDQCHNYSPSYQNGNDYLSYYCPYCGADMRGER